MAGTGSANAFLSHLEARRFSPATVRAYAFEIVCLARFLEERGIGLCDLVPTDVFDWIDWQSVPMRPGGKVVPIGAGRGAAAASVNRRVAAARALFEYLVLAGVRAENPVPAPRRGQGLRPKSRGLLGHLGPGRVRGGGRPQLASCPRRSCRQLVSAGVFSQHDRHAGANHKDHVMSATHHAADALGTSP